MRYGSKMLFEDVTTTFARRQRYGLTGPNGAGKSTFMTGEREPQREECKYQDSQRASAVSDSRVRATI